MKDLLKQIRQWQLIISKKPLYLKYGLYIFPIVIILLALAILFLVTIPQGLKLTQNNQSLDEIKQKKVKYQAKIVSLNKVDTESYKSNLNDILYILPSEKDIPSAIKSILDVLSSTGLTLTNFSLGSATPVKNGYQSFGVSVDVAGNVNQIKNLIELTDKASRLMKISNLTVNNNSSGGTQASIDLVVFYAPLDLTVKTSADQEVSLLNETDLKTLANIKQNISSIEQLSDEVITNTPTGKSDPFN